MTSKWLIGLCGVLLCGALVANDAEAGRLGGARSSGVQRSVTPPSRPAQQAAPQPQQQPTPAAQPSGGSRWLPILGGLALGGMLGYLFGGNGLMGILVLALLAVGAVVAFRALARGGSREAPRPLQYAGLNEQGVGVPPAAASAGSEAPRGRMPTGFDTASFLKAAKTNFIRLQAANDSGRLDEIREFTTDELFEELKRDIHAGQQTDVSSLEADLLEIATEGDRHWASVHFSGTIREVPGAAPAQFQEVWNLVKPANGSSGWLLAGIQQMH
jgi:predicted lipid-binding transport protein (Tim44 family)